MSDTVRRVCRGIEYSIHECPRRLSKELAFIFPRVDLSVAKIIPTCQKANVDLTNWGSDAALEKDELLETFMEWADIVCKELMKAGHWADYVDPCSGLPMLDKACNKPYNEVEAFSILLGYKQFDAGGCKVISHPEWGTHVYLATLFTNAPTEQILDVVHQLESEN